MRLIDADDVKELLLGLDSLPWEEEVDDLVGAIPTAYDVEKAVEEVKKIAGCNDKCAKTFYQGMGCKACMWNTMMNLIREGGVNG